MESVKIIQTNAEIGKGQEDNYSVIYAHKQLDPKFGHVFTSCWELSLEELLLVISTSRIWYQRCTFDFPPGVLEKYPDGLANPFQPMGIGAVNPMVDKSDDLLATSRFPPELVKFIARFVRMRRQNPEHMDLISNLELSLTEQLRTLAATLPNYGDDQAKSKVLEEIANVSLRLSHLHRMKHEAKS